jgi:hypothetical protein
MKDSKKAVWLLLLAVLLGSVIATPALAADSATVDLTMQNAVISISLDQSSWDAGPLALGARADSPDFTLSNTGNIPVDLSVSGTDATQVGGTGTWTLAGAGSAYSTDQFRLDLLPSVAGSGTQVTPTALPIVIYEATSLVAGGSYGFFLNLWMPTGVTTRGTYSSHVTLTATEHSGI